MPAQRLELDDHANFQKTEWRLQRLGWLVWSVLVVAALAGLLGSGPLSDRVAQSQDGDVVLQYDRFLRHHHPTRLEFSIRPNDSATDNQEGDDGKNSQPSNAAVGVMVEFNHEWLDSMEIRTIHPQPVATHLLSDGIAYLFRADAAASSTSIQFIVVPEGYGSITGKVRVHERSTLQFKQIVYP